VFDPDREPCLQAVADEARAIERARSKLADPSTEILAMELDRLYVPATLHFLPTDRDAAGAADAAGADDPLGARPHEDDPAEGKRDPRAAGKLDRMLRSDVLRKELAQEDEADREFRKSKRSASAAERKELANVEGATDGIGWSSYAFFAAIVVVILIMLFGKYQHQWSGRKG
jgi:hypothetical protein